MAVCRDVVVIGASAGGVEAVSTIVRHLPRNLPAAVFVTVHFPPHATSSLPHILSRAGVLPATHARNGEPIVRGHVYVAPPDHHLLLSPKGIRLVRGPTENGSRPAIDPMFRSAALVFGPRVVGVVLTGNLDDGTAGLLAVKRAGGMVVVQDPQDATFPSMPSSAVAHVDVDYVVPLEQIAPVLGRLLAGDPPNSDRDGDVSHDPRRENAFSNCDLNATEQPGDHPGESSAFSCPDCGGVLWEIRDGEFVRYRCRVGHGWTGDGLLAEQRTTLDTALWTALRALEESAALNEELMRRMEKRGNTPLMDRFAASARVSRDNARVVHDLLALAPSAGDDR